MRRITLAIATVLLSGACIPVPRRAVTQPPMDFTVTDADGTPVEAELWVAQWSNPHHRYHGYRTFETKGGTATISEERQLEWVMPLMIHGVPFYYWTWCVKAVGYAPARGETHEQTPEPVRVVLVPGDGDCGRPSDPQTVF